MSPSVKGLLVFFLIFLSLFCQGQQPAFRNYSVDDGLPSSEVYHVMQDSRGYIWMATNMGVSRFDGRNFRNFDVQNGLPENTVFEIFEDDAHRLWFISFPFQLSYFQNDSIHRYKHNDKLRELAGHGLIPLKKSFLVDIHENVFFSFLNGGKIYKISKAGKLDIVEDISGSEISVKVLDLNKHLLAAQNGEKSLGDFLIKYNSENQAFSSVIKKSKGRFLFGNIMVEMTKNDELVFVRNEFLTLIRKDGTHKSFNVNDRILWMNIEKDGTVWIGTEIGGAVRYDLSNNYDNHILEQYLHGQAISSIFADNEGGTWFSSLSSGVYYLPSKAFISYTHENGLSSINIQTIEIFEDKIFIGGDNYSPDIISETGISSFPISINDNKFINLLKGYHGKLWISAKTNLFVLGQNKLKRIINNHPKIKEEANRVKYIFSIKDIFPFDENKALIAQMRSISVVEGSKVIYDSYLDDSISLRVESIEQENHKSYLLGTFNGLWRYANGQLIYLGNKSNLLNKRITDIISLSEDNYILGTKGFGLVIKLKDNLFQITQKEGLSSNSITSLTLSGDTLWIGTNNGLNLLNVADLNKNSRINVFTKEHGLISNEINQLKYNKGRLYIACNGGLTIFNTRAYHPLRNPPPIFINAINIMGKDVVLDRNYTLNYDQNFITISYGGINFRDAGQLLYKYRLIGLSENWAYSRNLQVEYAFLPSGKYKFEVYAINSEGLTSAKPATLEFIIKPPFWKTWWFISLMIIVVILLFLTYFDWRIRNMRKEHNLQSDINRYREQALIRQMDPHFVFNSLNSIQSFIIKNDSISSSHYLSKFARLMRVILNNSQKQAVCLSDEVDALNLYMELESMRFKQKFDYKITVDPSLETDLTYIPAFLVQPFIENSIWHGIMNVDRPGFIHVDFLKDDKQIICTIEDNGIGRSKSLELKSDIEKKRKSMGISIVESRLNLLSSYYNLKMKIIFTDVIGSDNSLAGTKVTINLPIIN